MPPHTLYAYVAGNDIHEVAIGVRRELEAFVGSVRWTRPTWVVDHVHPRTPAMSPDDLPDWDLGLNHELPACGSTADGWFADIAQIVVKRNELAAETGREFVLGLVDCDTGLGEDVCSFDGQGIDMLQLRAILGAPPPPLEAS
jgi:hypothetical protein